MSKGLQALKELKKRYGKNFSLQDDERTHIIEKELKDYKELTSKPIILYGRTHRHTQALVDLICKNYKEVRITNLEDEKKLKALEIIVDKLVDIRTFISSAILSKHETPDAYNFIIGDVKRHLTQEEFDLLKKVLKNE